MVGSIYNILILENNFSYTLELEMILGEIGHQVIASLDNDRDALSFIHSNDVDVVLLGVSPKEFSKHRGFIDKIQKLDIPLVLMSSEPGFEEYQLYKPPNMIGFFIKPIHPFTLESVLDFALQNHLPTINLFGDSFFSKTRNKHYHKILIKDVLYIEAFGNYSYIHTHNEKYTSKLRFKELENVLNPKGFLRVHRSFIINTLFIKSVNMENNTIELENLNNLPLSRTYKQALWNHVKQRII